MKKYFGLILSTILLLGTSVFATYDDFSRQLETMGVDVTNIEKQNSISRYDLTRLLNSVECKDCINPSQNIVDKYGENYRSTFTAQEDKDFSDVSYIGAIYNSQSYYYCVAYVGDNSYMRGYPKATSPICGGQFCGTKNTTTAEFIQVVINILAKYVYKDIRLNRKEVNTRISKLKADSYEAKNFSDNDKNIITERSKNCEGNCILQKADEVQIYLKYCMFNLNKCSMQEVGKIQQGSWPVAELNLLYSQNIIDIDQSLWRNTAKNIDGKTVVETLFKLNGEISCTFNNDYDCDGLDNAKDNCPNTHNPNQKDTDNDNVGDVCDDDIDNDGIKNPKGIIDAEEKIDISKRSENTDNCLFVANPGQEDVNQNSIGNVCENIGNEIGLYINMDTLEGVAPVTTTFSAITEGDVQDISRDFGDGTQGKGASIQHTFYTPGMYTVQATAQGNTIAAKAQIRVIIGGQKGDTKGLQVRSSSIGGKNNTETTLSASLIGRFDTIEWIFPKENISIKKGSNETFTRIFRQSGENPVMVKGYANGELGAISYFTMGINEGKGAILRSNSTNPQINQKVLFDTKTFNISQEDIVKVDRDFGDDTKKSNTTLTVEYAYTTPGKKIVTQTISLSDGEELTNIITIQIEDKTLLTSYALLMIPSKLITNIGQNIDFSTRIVGTLLKIPFTQITEFGDGTTQQKSGTEKLPSIFVHTYQANGSITPQNSMYIDQCTYLKNQATIAIKGTDICLNAKIQGTLDTYTCDLDGDTIPDICDTDIDNDGIPNLLGLVNFENKDCSYESNLNISNTNINQTILAKHYQTVCSLDNAPFNNNPDQLDLNQDGIGDIQKIISTNTSNEDTLDADSDGIIDTNDLCPTIQETRNGVNDEDGCPEINEEMKCNQTTLTQDTLVVTTECNQCPCQFGDFSSDITTNDQVRAILRDKKKTIQYKFSLPWIVDFQ